MSAFRANQIQALVATALYYLTLGSAVRTSAFVAIVGMIGLYLLAAYLTWPYAIAAFVVGWIFQFIGHAYEGKAPAFLTNLLHLLVGPLWVARARCVALRRRDQRGHRGRVSRPLHRRRRRGLLA